eukprot:TRINITY_DN45560_c0_g1_i1.p1 TRINITY_DN45560_c0_g1~~TRINITY_DN45560_c0_g1_i1.p1  ORF type:complete len:268 (+),score=31.96 TRINITY_DN45560_c0_g1_i1:63-806(+)
MVLRVVSFLLLLLFDTVSSLKKGTSDANVSVYFGAGCFWHVQHEFVQAERKLLGRSDSQLTSIVGYAAARGGGPFCYQDGKLHAEVVEVIVPTSALSDIAAVYWRLFVGKDRSHSNDKGPNYRSVVGVPGGMGSSLLPIIDAAQKGNVAQTFQLKRGVGDDPDTLGSAIVWVYDTNEFPFQQGEFYHQFHDDYLPSGKYPASYNALAQTLEQTGRLNASVCSGSIRATLALSPVALLLPLIMALSLR